MKRIPLSQGKEAIVDDCDYEYLTQWKWFARKGNAHSDPTYYAVRNQYIPGVRPQWRRVAMHLEVARRSDLPLDDGLVDHQDRNGLNNRRSNLRIVSPSESNRNRRAWSRTGFKGVTRLPSGRYRARVKRGGRDVHIGVFGTPLEADQAFRATTNACLGECTA